MSSATGGKLLPLGSAVLVLVAVTSVALAQADTDARQHSTLMRVESRIPSDARRSARPLVITLGGPVYCGLTLPLARYLGASLLCPDYGPNGERSGASRSKRMEDWGNPRYLDAVARLPVQLERKGLRVSELVLVGTSYAGYAAAELAATHPELEPRALIVVDGFLDLAERFRALSRGQPTRAEMTRALGGPLAQMPERYAERSPSDHLVGLADDIRNGMRFVDVWSVAPSAVNEFNGAMCSRLSNAFWLRRLARILDRPVVGYVTRLPHAAALRDRWRQLLALAALAPAAGPLPATKVALDAGRRITPLSYCAASKNTAFSAR